MDFPKITNFKIEKRLKHSIWYTSYAALDKSTSESCIIRVLNDEIAQDEILAQEFISHAQILKGLDNEHICKIYDQRHDIENIRYYVKSEQHNFQPLSKIILEEFSLSLFDLIDIFIQLCDTLRYANLYGVLHGMLNPNSIFINSDGKIKIDDFGFNWHIPALLKKDDEESRYLAQYIAPDYYHDIKTVDGRSDIYSLGLLLYEVLAGKPAVTGKTMKAITTSHVSSDLPAIDFKALELPIEIGKIIAKATNKSKAQRYQNFKQIIDDFKKLTKTHLSDYSESVAPIPLAAPMFEDDDFIIDEENPPPEESIFPETISPKIIYSGAGAVLFVFLILFVTNYIPFSDNEHDYVNPNELQAVTSTDIPQTDDSKDISNKEEIIPEPLIKDRQPELDLEDEPTATSMQPEEVVDVFKPDETEVLKSIPQKTSASVYVVSENQPIQADIFVENKYIGKTNRNGEIELTDLDPDAILNLRVYKDGYKSSERLLNLSRTHETYTFDLKKMKQEVGTVVFTAVPAADKIFIDGVLQEGSTPLTVKLKSGEYKVALVNSAYAKRHEETINLKKSQTLTVKHDFTIRKVGNIAVSLTNAAEFGFAYVFIDGKPWKGNSKTTPLEVELPVGIHKISVKRDGFTSSPNEQVINIESSKTKYVSFTLNQIGTN